jgi:NAD(P)-dependent dehydrogenase (short-subunit alcohol dehydrogenase family)
MQSILITGSNRGLGLEWVRQYTVLGWRVYATCRHPQQADDLQHLAKEHSNITIHPLDITIPEQVNDLAKNLDGAKLDILVNNAGIYIERWGHDKLGTIDYDAWLQTLIVNTLGAVRVTEALRNNLARGDKRLVVAVTSHMGSIADTTTPNDYAYRTSKAALNAAMKGLTYELATLGIGVLLLHPGWVRTRMGGSDAPLSAEESVRDMRALADRFTPNESGMFYRHDGTIIPW